MRWRADMQIWIYFGIHYAMRHANGGERGSRRDGFVFSTFPTLFFHSLFFFFL
jgi:hypothetical protein